MLALAASWRFPTLAGEPAVIGRSAAICSSSTQTRPSSPSPRSWRAAGRKEPFGGSSFPSPNCWGWSRRWHSRNFTGFSSNFTKTTAPSRFLSSVSSSSLRDERFVSPTSDGEDSAPSYAWPDKQKPRICILGGGFGGLYTALRLDSLVWPDDKRPQVYPARLVLALGAEAKLDVVPGSAEYAIPFSTLEHALKVDEALKSLERTRFGESASPIQVAIVGCGYSGVELAATISERLKTSGTVLAINVETSICPNAPPGNREAALKILEARNTRLFLGYFVSSIKEVFNINDSPTLVIDGELVDSDKQKSRKQLILELQPAQRGLQSGTLEADLVLWTVGSKPLIPQLQLSDQPNLLPLNGRGQAETDETLRVKGHPRIFAIGDSAALRDPSGKLLPATAQVAFQQADFAGWNLWAAINDRPLLPFRYQNLGEMMTLGRNDAAISASFIEGLTLEGPIGHAARKLIYLYRMPTDEHRAKVGISWLTKTAIDYAASLQSAITNVFAGL